MLKRKKNIKNENIKNENIKKWKTNFFMENDNKKWQNFSNPKVIYIPIYGIEMLFFMENWIFRASRFTKVFLSTEKINE